MEEKIAEYQSKMGDKVLVTFGSHPDVAGRYSVLVNDRLVKQFDMLGAGEAFSTDIHEQIEYEAQDGVIHRIEPHKLMKHMAAQFDQSKTRKTPGRELEIARYKDSDSGDTVYISRVDASRALGDLALEGCVNGFSDTANYLFMTNSSENPLRFDTIERIYADSHEIQQAIEERVKGASESGLCLEEVVSDINCMLSSYEVMANARTMNE
jgi:hypothetical protein